MKRTRLFSREALALLAGAILLAAGCTKSTLVEVSLDSDTGEPGPGADDSDTGTDTGEPGPGADDSDTGEPGPGADDSDTGTDTGDAPKDTGDAPKDTGTDPKDTGTEPEDTGPADTGTEPEDTGPEDTGTEPEDTGPDPLAENGVACFADSECDSGFCADGVCCESSCDGDCAVCNAAGFEGTCTPQQANTVCRAASDHACDAPEVCDGTSFTCPIEDAFKDGAFCDVDDAPCVTGGKCTAADTCSPVYAAPDTPCGDALEPCDTSKCDDAGQCIATSAANDTTCGTAADVCFADSTCQSGVCTVQYQPGTFVCATGDAEDTTGEDLYRCYEEDTCGAELQKRVRNSYCDGVGACHKATADDWVTQDSCNETTHICYADATDGACVPCGADDIPDDTCDGDKAIQYYAAGEDGYANGTCVANACANYNYAETDCAATGLVCDAGTCVDAPVALDCALCGGFDYKGHCWFLGAEGQSCTDACNANNLVYDGATRDVAGVRRDQNHIFYSVGICQNLVHALSPATGEMQIFEGANNNYAVGCTYLKTLLGFLVNLPILHLEMETTADATRDDHRRVCACQAGGEFTCNAANARLYTEPVAVSADTCHAYYHDSGALALHYRGVQSDSDAITLRIRYCDGRTLSETLKPSGGPSGDVWTTLPQPPENCRIYVHVQSMNGYAWPLYIRSN